MVYFENRKVLIFIYFHHKFIQINPMTQQMKVTSIMHFYPVISPFKNSLQLNIDNDKFFGPKSKVSSVFNNTISYSIDCEAFQPQNDIPTAEYLFEDKSSNITSINKSMILPLTTKHSNTISSK